jgi:hypothetical protein
MENFKKLGRIAPNVPAVYDIFNVGMKRSGMT